MIGPALLRAAREAPGAAFLLGADGATTYADAAHKALRVGFLLKARGISRLACHALDSPKLVMLMLGAALVGCEVCVINRHYGHAELESVLKRFEFTMLAADSDIQIEGVTVLSIDALFADAAAMTPPPTSEPHADPRLLVLTTGTTGLPKGARYTWANLSAQAKTKSDLAGSRWLLAYHLNHFAGLQMLVHVLANRATMVIPAGPEVEQAQRALVEHHVEYVSGTPTFFRFLAAQMPESVSKSLALKQITLGGEAVPQDLLGLIHERFPSAKVSQIFATTEIGSAFSVRDMSNGLPASLLEKKDETGPQIKIVDGELHILSTHGMLGYFGEPEITGPVWRATGDLVEQRGDRVYFVGRKSETINVGGVKVHPLPIEEVVQNVPGVVAVYCYGKKNPITGQIVAVDVLPEATADRVALEEEIRRACESLARHAKPRIIRFVESLDMANRKVIRRGQ